MTQQEHRTNRSGADYRAIAANGGKVPGGLARYLGPIGRWPWLKRVMADARIGAWIRNRALRIAWIAFVLVFPGVLTLWTVAFLLRVAARQPRVAARLVPVRARLVSTSQNLAAAAHRGLVGERPSRPLPWDLPSAPDIV